MAYVVIEDDTGSIESLVFNNVLSSDQKYIKEDEPVLLTGRISVRDEKDTQLICERIRPLADEGAEQSISESSKTARNVSSDTRTADKKLYVRVPGENSKEYQRVKLVLKMFPGDEQIVVYFEDTKKKVGSKCIIHPALVKDLQEHFGADNVVVRQ